MQGGDHVYVNWPGHRLDNKHGVIFDPDVGSMKGPFPDDPRVTLASVKVDGHTKLQILGHDHLTVE
jgi:hypothetical protein